MDEEAEASLGEIDAELAPPALEPDPEPTPEPEAAMPEETKQEKRTIRLIFDPAIESRGKYQRGIEYTVPADEAEYLISTGNFEEVSNVPG